jgi:hypothetical protein
MFNNDNNNVFRDYKDLSLIELLGFLMSNEFSPTKVCREVRVTPGGKDMSMRQIARSMFGVIYEKFMQCSEKERRSIARSDMEFIYIMKTLVIQKMQLVVDKNEMITEELEREIYQDIWIPTPISDIPKIPRGGELFWAPVADPIVAKELTVQEKERDTKISNVLYAVWDNVHELYPNEYAKTWPMFMRSIEKGRQLVINTSHKETSDILLHEKTGQKFYSVAIPWITDLVIKEVIKVCSLGRKRQREMYSRVADMTWNKLVGGERASSF